MFINLMIGFLLILFFLSPQESFEIPRGQGHGGGDIELGAYAMNSGDLGLDSFFKKVFILIFL